MANATGIVQDIIAPSDTQRAFINARIAVNAATKAHREVKKVAGQWATGDADITDVENAKDVYTAMAAKAYEAIECLGKDMRPSNEVRLALSIPAEIVHGGDLGVMLKVAMPGGGKMTAAIRTFLKG